MIQGGSNPLFLTRYWCLLITVISSDNNRKASDVRSFHPAVTQQAKWELWKWTSLPVSSPRVFDTLRGRSLLPTRDETTFSLAIIVFSQKWQRLKKRKPVMLPLSLTAAVWNYHYYCSCHYGCQPLTGLIHATACEYGAHRLRSRLTHCPSKWPRSDKAECWHFTGMEDISLVLNV